MAAIDGKVSEAATNALQAAPNLSTVIPCKASAHSFVTVLSLKFGANFGMALDSFRSVAVISSLEASISFSFLRVLN